MAPNRPTWVDPLDELQQYMQGLGEAPEAVAPSVHHNNEFDFVSQPVVSPMDAQSPYPPGHEPKPAQNGPEGLSAAPTQKPSLLSKMKGWFKRAEAQPQQNSLTWRGPGYAGKGIYYNDTGQVFTWPVSGPDRAPHHLEMHQYFRPDWRGNERDFTAQGHVPFNISPGGAIDNSWDPDGLIHPHAAAAIQQVDPRLWVGDANNAGGFGHARGILDNLDDYRTAASEDELHYALEIPEHIKDKIEEWVHKQDWPEGTELEDREEYHITLLYSEDGHKDHHDADWLYPTEGYSVKVVGLDEFGEGAKKAVVLRIDSDEALEHANDLLDAAENKGLGVSRFPGGYKPHLTVAYGFEKPAYARYPRLRFKTGPASVSEPRTARVEGMGRPLHHIQPHVHYHPYTGLPCTCPWGQPADNKAKHPLYREAGSQNVRKVRNQNQKIFRDEYGQNYLKALDQLVEYHPDIEPLVPWIASRAKHADIIYHPGRDELMVTPRDLGHVTNDINHQQRREILNNQGLYESDRQRLLQNLQHPQARDIIDAVQEDPSHRRWLTHYRPGADAVADWGQWANARQHPTRRGVVFDKLPVSDLHTRVQQFKQDLEERRKRERWLENYAGLTPPIHTFQGGDYHNWTVNQLRNIEDCEAESAAMGHCIGQEDQPYRGNVDAGNIEAYSLRDEEGYPHATWHYNPDGSLAHTQGQSGAPMDDYRNLISAWANKVGKPDDEIGEHDLDNLEHDPCPDCGHALDEYDDCDYCGYPYRCPNCGEPHYNDEVGCSGCGHGRPECPNCHSTNYDEDDGCRECGYPHESEVELESPSDHEMYMDQYHPHSSLHELATSNGHNVGPDTEVTSGDPYWPDVVNDVASNVHPRNWPDLMNTIHYNGHSPAVDEFLEDHQRDVANGEEWPDPDLDNFADKWQQHSMQNFTPEGRYQRPQWTRINDLGRTGWQTAWEQANPTMFNETWDHDPPDNRAYNYEPAQEGGWDLPKCRTCGTELHNPSSAAGQCTPCRAYEMWNINGRGGYNRLPPPGYQGSHQPPVPATIGEPVPAGGNPMGIGGGWYGGIDGECPHCGRMDRHMHDAGETGEQQPAQLGWACPNCASPSPIPGHCINSQCTYNAEPFQDRQASIEHKACGCQGGCTCPDRENTTGGWFKQAMPADPDWWSEWSKRGPLYHTTFEHHLPRIMQEGLRPSSEIGESRYEKNWFKPRPGHTYLTNNIEHAHNHSQTAPGEGKSVMLAIDPSYLDPAHVNPDEDWMMERNTLPDEEYERIVQQESPGWQIGQGLTNAWPQGLGQTAENIGLGNDPAHTHQGLEDFGSVAYRGTIPPEAIRQLYYDPEREDYFDDPPQISLFPNQEHAASVRYSAVRSWTKGQWGKGLVDNDDIVHVWPDTPEHAEVPSLLDQNPQVNFLVNPGGGFLLQGGRAGRDGWHQFIQGQVPELWPMPQLRTKPGVDLQDMGDDDTIIG